MSANRGTPTAQARTGGRVRILHLLSGCTVGGCERHVLSLLARLDRRRYQSWLACFVAEPDAAEPLVPRFRALGVRVVDLGAERHLDPRAIWRLAQVIRRGRFALIHAHSFRTELAAVLCGKLLGPRLLGQTPIVVRTVHNTDPFYVQPQYARVARASAAHLDRIIVISDAVGRYLREHGGLRDQSMSRIYYGIEANPLESERVLPDQRPPTIGIVARLAPQKGHRVLLDAMPRVLAKVPRARLRVIGHEELSTVGELRAYAERVGVADRVSFEGFRGDVPALLRELDLLVLPSFWEGFGLVLLEAMAAGRPVVATRVGPIPEVVMDGETGLLVEPGNAAALAEAIVRVLTDAALSERLGRAGRSRAAEHFGIVRMVAETEALYEDLLARHGSRAA